MYLPHLGVMMKLTEDQVLILGSIIKCPFDDRCSECPLLKFDSKSIKEKLDYVKSLTIDEQQSIINYHKICLNIRENY